MIHRFGIRHHGPGSARSLERAFAALRPDCVLIEGPPDADEALPFAGDAGMKPPVALLVHAAADPSRAVFYPFAHFSPEWVAMRWALANAVPVRFIDLPIQHQLDTDEDPDEPLAARRLRRHVEDPLHALAAAAGYDDEDLFWDRLVESASVVDDPFAIFAVIERAMRAARETGAAIGLREERREAYMRQQIRAAERALFQRIAVVIGAWHGPALDLAAHTVKADAALLKGLPKTRTEVAWIPWTAARLAAESGYGAGVASPGWYAHLYEEMGQRRPASAPGEHASIATSWAVRAARLLREVDVAAAGPAPAVEVVRTADALAALRTLAAPGLAELREALLAVCCRGDEARLALIRRRLEIGEEIGEVPPEAPATPLRRDVAASLKSLRLATSPEAKRHEWDLRKALDQDRVIFLHRLQALEIPFGRQLAGSGTVGEGTFKEIWELRWDPAFEVELALAARWGHDLAGAASALVLERAKSATLPELSRELQRALDGRLPRAIDGVLAAMRERAALVDDVLQLGRALPGLARIIRYSDVRETTGEHVRPVFGGLFARFVIGLPAAAALVDDAGAEAHAGLLDEVTQALSLIASAPATEASTLIEEWRALLGRLADGRADQAPAHARIQGRATRLLLDAEVLGSDDLERLASLALGPALAPAKAAGWIEGLVAGAGILLEQQDALWLALDRWLGALAEDAFVVVLPVLRRTFSDFSPAERRRMSALLARAANAPAPAPAPTPTLSPSPAFDLQRVALLGPVLATIYRSPR